MRVQIKLKKTTSPPALYPRQDKWQAHIGAGFISLLRAACRTAAVAALFLASSVPLAQQPSGTAGRSAAALEVIVLGSGGPAALGRASSSYLVLLHGVPRV